MRLALLSLAFLLAAPAEAQAPVDSTFFGRNLRQQVAALEVVRERDGAPLSTAPADLDALVAAATARWLAADDAPGLPRLNPYVSRWLLTAANGNRELPPAAACHNYAAHVVPAFLAEFEVVRTVDPAHAPLIFWGHNYVGGPLSLTCPLDAEAWAALDAALAEAPALYQAYLDTGAATTDDLRSKIGRARAFFAERAALYDVLRDLRAGRLDAAFAGLAASAARAEDPADLRALGDALWRAYAAADAADYALGTLDLLARSLTAADLPRDTLAAWYAAASPDGPERFAQVAAAPAPLVPTAREAPLAGVYTDLQTGRPVDLADLRGRTLVVDLWATWCGPCVGEIPELRALVADYGDRITFVSVNTDPTTSGDGAGVVQDFMATYGVDYAVLLDDPERPLLEAFGRPGLPAKYVVGPDGRFLVSPTRDAETVSLAEVRAYLDATR